MEADAAVKDAGDNASLELIYVQWEAAEALRKLETEAMKQVGK